MEPTQEDGEGGRAVETVVYALAGAALAALVDVLVRELYMACRKRLGAA
jgi:hypothetical protein